jgi:hypothetical protein
MGLTLNTPEHATLRRRSRTLPTHLKHRPAGPTHLIVDSTALAVRGEGEWAT